MKIGADLEATGVNAGSDSGVSMGRIPCRRAVTEPCSRAAATVCPMSSLLAVGCTFLPWWEGNCAECFLIFGFFLIQFKKSPPKIPYKAIALAIVLFMIGTFLIIIGALLLAGYISKGVSGLITFLLRVLHCLPIPQSLP